MKKNIIYLFLMLICLGQPNQIKAQGKQSSKVTSSNVTAQVVDTKGNPIADVTVLGDEGSVQTKEPKSFEFV